MGGKGLINVKITDKTGQVVAIKEVTDSDELMLVTRNGVINRQPANQIRVIGRNTQGVRLINLDEGDELVDLARLSVEALAEDSIEEAPGTGESGPEAVESAEAAQADD